MINRQLSIPVPIQAFQNYVGCTAIINQFQVATTGICSQRLPTLEQAKHEPRVTSWFFHVTIVRIRCLSDLPKSDWLM